MNSSRHDLTYTILLALLAVWTFACHVDAAAEVIRAPGYETAGMFLSTLIVAAFFSAEVGIASLRIVNPEQRRKPTLFLNLALLLYFPLGTALAIYGFCKVDKQVGLR